MKNFKEFVNQPINEEYDYKYPRVWKVDKFDINSSNIFQRQLNSGFTPYYLNGEYGLEPIKVASTGYPYTESDKPVINEFGRPVETVSRRSLQHSKNPFGLIYFLKQGELSKISPIANKVKETIDKHKESINLLVDLIGSTINDLDKKKD